MLETVSTLAVIVFVLWVIVKLAPWVVLALGALGALLVFCCLIAESEERRKGG